jgi:iron(III) transport system permease protein
MVAPSLMYAAVLVFFLGFELFGLPLVLGDPGQILVLATYLYKLTNKLGTPSYQLMAVVVVAIIAISLPLVALQRHLLRSANRYVSVKGKAAGQKPVPIGIWRWPALALILGWLLVTAVIPVVGLVLLSVLLDLIVNLAAHRWRSAWTWLLDYIVLLPRAMPGLVAGLAIFWVFLFTAPLRPLRQTLISVWLAYTLVWLAYGMRLVSTSLLQIGPELEEAGRVVGATAARVSRDITVPLVRAGLIGSWVLIFITFVREYSTGVYLLSPGTEVIGSLLVSLWGTGAIDLVTALSTVNILMLGFGLVLMAIFVKQRP